MDMSDVWSALADPTRRKILSLLKKQDMNAGEIAEHFNMTKPSISHHLSQLKQANLVTADKQGQNVIYSLNISVFEEIMQLVSELAHREEETHDA